MEIPHTALSASALRGIVEEFVTREGTDYGNRVYDLTEKVNRVIADIHEGKVRIFYDEDTQTCNLATGEQIRRAQEPDEDDAHEGGQG